MADRLVIVAAVGGDRQARHAHAFGMAVAKSDCILLTGGGDHNDGEVKNAAVQGCLAARREGAAGRAIGVLPSDRVRWESRDAWHLLLHSGLKHYLCNLINGVTPDIVVVFGGSRGTLAEAAFAMAAGRPTSCSLAANPGEPAVVRLRRNFEQYFARDDSPDVEMYLNRPLQYFRRDLHSPALTTRQLRELLCDRLHDAADSLKVLRPSPSTASASSLRSARSRPRAFRGCQANRILDSASSKRARGCREHARRRRSERHAH